MSQEQISVSVEDSAYDLMEGLTAIAVAIKSAKSQGIASEAEAGVVAAISAFSTKLGELQNLKSDLVSDHTGFYRGLLNGSLDLGTAILS